MSTATGIMPHFEAKAAVSMGTLRNRSTAIGLIAVAVLLGVAACTQIPGIRSAFGLADSRPVPSAAVPAEQVRKVEAMTVDDKSQIIVEGSEAEERNAAIPVSALPVESPGSFILPESRGTVYTTALKCLAQAVYYEAAREPIEGRRAVAQVVLNRVRSPLYPDSVCGVVYEGSKRTTGCQFSFTCDGSLLRAPMPAFWREAEEVARKALAGSVEASVGTATNYHADYVLPKWAFTLAKIEQIGRHIFYRLHGKWGQRTVFTSAYGGVERIPALNYDGLRARLLASARETAEQAPAPGLTVPPAVTDRHAENDVGGRLDVTREWRLSIPDPVTASSKYQAAIAANTPAAADAGKPVSASPTVIAAR
ncbi:MAG TPA: cell wall hydrolase [Novosphingobium sp.]|nr:cell wall hydrolase [Novosphingobium sp.]